MQTSSSLMYTLFHPVTLEEEQSKLQKELAQTKGNMGKILVNLVICPDQREDGKDTGKSGYLPRLKGNMW